MNINKYNKYKKQYERDHQLLNLLIIYIENHCKII